ncbi:MAG: N-6 DNA methylase, partial [Acidobacteria bacterium]|nr:N-6 DNA methylase [Acidobacteriota bacterium]
QIAQTHITRIEAILADETLRKERQAFDALASWLRRDLNPAVDDAQVIEMLAQHLITRPVFEALFGDDSFAAQNPVSVAMQRVVDVLEAHNLGAERETLDRFYASVRRRAEGLDTADARQKVILELYDKFFRFAFPRMAERLGIVYTPVEVVDFVLRSVDAVLREHFDESISSEGVHVLDPFTGTGTFLARLLQLDLIADADLQRKYERELHANEIVLLAYYIAAVNVEAVYHGRAATAYTPFPGICLRDTFQSFGARGAQSDAVGGNQGRVLAQDRETIRVIVGNPPYSAGQRSANDNNQNVAYEALDERIRETYAARSEASNKNALYDSYIRGIRWASDRIGERGVIGFVTNAGFLDANAADGMRKCLVEEFSSIYVFHLRGNQRTQGEVSRREGGKIFGQGSRTPVAITILVKDPAADGHGTIHWHDVGDYLDREEKLRRVSGFGSVAGIAAAEGWTQIEPNEHGDWANQRSEDFGSYLPLGSRKGERADALFELYSNGLKSQRDAWVYNSSNAALRKNVERLVRNFNGCVHSLQQALDRGDVREDDLATEIDA